MKQDKLQKMGYKTYKEKSETYRRKENIIFWIAVVVCGIAILMTFLFSL